MRYLHYLIFILAINTISSFAQERKEFNDKFAAAELYFSEERYPLALPLYLDLLKIEPENANLNYKAGVCYLNSATEKSRAAEFLERAEKNVSPKHMELEVTEKRAPILAYYYLGSAYHHLYKFDDAIKQFELYKSKAGKKEEVFKAERYIEMCKHAIDMMANPVGLEVLNLGDEVNSKFPDLSPVISVDESTLIFTSGREGSTGEQITDDGSYFEDIYIAHRQSNGEWTKATSIGPTINTSGHEATVGLSADGSKLLIYKDDNGDGNIYMSRLNGEEWSYPERLGGDINSKAWEPSASFSADGNAIYFVSDRKGGFGGRDIYRVVKLPNGEWSLAHNLGPGINTAFDEDGPFMHPDGRTLYFSSNGHKTMGGFDVFYSIFNEDNNTWSGPQNVGYPINTPDDDVFYVVTADGKRAYYTSSKEGGMGEKDIYLINLFEADTRSVTVLVGKILNPNGEDISNNRITVTDKKSGEIQGEYTANYKTGKYVVALTPGLYTIKYEVDDKEIHSEELDIPENSDYQTLQREIQLAGVNATPEPKKEEKKPEVKEGAAPAVTVKIPEEFHVYMNYNSKDVDPKDPNFQRFVSELADALKASKGLTIVVESSASKVPTKSNSSNEKLAADRAASAKALLIRVLKERGVSEASIKNVKSRSVVQGPDYNNDFIENKRTYEKFQYVKIAVEK